MSSVVLITGASSGIGNLTARALAGAGHTVYASMRDPGGRNADHAGELLDFARHNGLDLRIVELDVRDQASVDAAVTTVVEATGRLDTVVHNAGHLFVGYVEAFTAENVTSLFDVNVIGAQRVNRAVLPHLRARRSGTLLYVGSTSSVVVPAFLGPYVASKAAFDILAQVTAYEVGRFGIETTIVMPGPFTKGTSHFPNADHAGDIPVARDYDAVLGDMVARNEAATETLFRGADADPVAVAEEITRILALPPGTRPFRSVVDFTDAGVEELTDALLEAQEKFLDRMGFGELFPGAAPPRPAA
ncbi:SDR family oxidoreductase [Nonomuraea aridisoli]|uniref:Oxidoreductase n=1 Tax=Nonomuraea aridisoli TaxID=2070368 RepID=A0A2W2E3G7_9ACTN|nr:SDR family oxidoreductase [Nonomuraea aridisoli]PZG18796.1 oxidoreductase [Nonomuraea aridisoli]